MPRSNCFYFYLHVRKKGEKMRVKISKLETNFAYELILN